VRRCCPHPNPLPAGEVRVRESSDILVDHANVMEKFLNVIPGLTRNPEDGKMPWIPDEDFGNDEAVRSSAKPYLVTFGKESIPFTIDFSARRGLKISVLPDRHVVVSAPAGKAVEEVIERVRRRAAWIVRQREYFERFSPIQPPRQYVSGETHRYLGRQLRLKLVQDREESVKLLGKYLFVRVAKPSDKARVKLLVEGWFKDHGRKMIAERLDKCLAQMQKTGIHSPVVRFQKMEKRWGSCSRKGTIPTTVKNSTLCWRDSSRIGGSGKRDWRFSTRVFGQVCSPRRRIRVNRGR